MEAVGSETNHITVSLPSIAPQFDTSTSAVSRSPRRRVSRSSRTVPYSKVV